MAKAVHGRFSPGAGFLGLNYFLLGGCPLPAVPLGVHSPTCFSFFFHPMLLSPSFSHSQTTVILIKPRGLTFSPRYLAGCTKSILRPCQPRNKPRLFPIWDFPALVFLAVRSKLNLHFHKHRMSPPILVLLCLVKLFLQA